MVGKRAVHFKQNRKRFWNGEQGVRRQLLNGSEMRRTGDWKNIRFKMHFSGNVKI